ncbi:MAG: hypothetical protein A4E54_01753 [Pelotomaculum sp. PtaB.Bin117]|nr:MAG: hypothetical protein A4E54_01753 [Pelotomaculum sp. PtaB.Bin117]OPY60372.1 MAG: hypothetical protein A4E56_02738 [Pelotomaculum sp. PtaU1.Bin065]
MLKNEKGFISIYLLTIFMIFLLTILAFGTGIGVSV